MVRGPEGASGMVGDSEDGEDGEDGEGVCYLDGGGRWMTATEKIGVEFRRRGRETGGNAGKRTATPKNRTLFRRRG